MNTHVNILILSDNICDLKPYLHWSFDNKLLVYNHNLDFSANDKRQACVHLWMHGINARRYFMIGHIDYIFYCIQSIDQFVHLLKFRESLKCLDNLSEFIFTDRLSEFQGRQEINIPCFDISEMLSIIQKLTTKLMYHRIKQLNIEM